MPEIPAFVEHLTHLIHSVRTAGHEAREHHERKQLYEACLRYLQHKASGFGLHAHEAKHIVDSTLHASWPHLSDHAKPAAEQAHELKEALDHHCVDWKANHEHAHETKHASLGP